MKILVAHPAQQHSYRLATALKKAGLLDKYITTVYYQKGNLTFWLAKFLRGKLKIKTQGRQCPYLDKQDIVQFCEGEGLLKLACMHLPFFKKYYTAVKYHTADRFAKKVAAYAIKHRVDAVVTYDDSSPLLFEILKKKAPHIVRILDMSSAAIPYLHTLCEKDCQLAPNFAQRLRRERASFWDTTVLNRSQREIKASQYFLVPSQFVAHSLQQSGATKKQFLWCPYGVDVSQFQLKPYSVPARPLQFVYVGGMKELKGIYYLMEAFKRLGKQKAQLTIVGAVKEQDEDLQPYREQLHFAGPVLHDKMPALLQQMDVFICPSLAEGLSLSSIEAAACGLALIVTENSGVNDLLVSGKEGFVIPIQSIDAIVEKINWFIEHPDKIEPMGRAARKLAEKYTWEAYYERAGKIIEDVVKNYVPH